MSGKLLQPNKDIHSKIVPLSICTSKCFPFLSSGDKDGSKVTTVVATPGQGPDRPQEVSYTDTKVIGNGSFGVVYQAKLCDSGELVAIKKVLQDKRFKVREAHSSTYVTFAGLFVSKLSRAPENKRSSCNSAVWTGRGQWVAVGRGSCFRTIGGPLDTSSVFVNQNVPKELGHKHKLG